MRNAFVESLYVDAMCRHICAPPVVIAPLTLRGQDSSTTNQNPGSKGFSRGGTIELPCSDRLAYLTVRMNSIVIQLYSVGENTAEQ